MADTGGRIHHSDIDASQARGFEIVLEKIAENYNIARPFTGGAYARRTFLFADRNYSAANHGVERVFRSACVQ